MSRKLEIAAISAEDLRIGRRSVKKQAFVVVKIGGETMRTIPDGTGGSYQAWHEKLETEFAPETSPEIMLVEVYCRKQNKDLRVGTARVPVKDFTGSYAPEGYLHCLSYRLWDDGGRRNGIVNFTARVSTAAS